MLDAVDSSITGKGKTRRVEMPWSQARSSSSSIGRRTRRQWATSRRAPPRVSTYPLRAERAVEKPDDAPLALDRVLQDRPEGAGPLGVEPEVGDAGGGEIHGDELGEKTPVHDGVVLQHQQLVGVGLEKRTQAA